MCILRLDINSHQLQRNQLGGQLLNILPEQRGKPTNPFSKFPPSDTTMPTVTGQEGVRGPVSLARMFVRCKNSLRRADHLALVVYLCSALAILGPS